MPIRTKRCEFCQKPYLSSHADTKWCSERCRYRNRMENHRFIVPVIPKSGIEGIYFNRQGMRWEAYIKVQDRPRRWKYLGGFKEKAEAIEFQRQVLAAPARDQREPTPCPRNTRSTSTPAR